MAEKRKFYGMRNDYMFHAVLQKNEGVLRNLLATLMEIDEAEIESCHIENPIELGKEIEGKECILDVEDGYLYSDKLCIKVLDLTQLEKAKLEPGTNKKLLKWASIFKAETLEELEQLASGEEVFENMVVMSIVGFTR